MKAEGVLPLCRERKENKRACFREKVGEGVWMEREFQTLVLSEDYAGFAISVFFPCV